jgi:hypothetical protein
MKKYHLIFSQNSFLEWEIDLKKRAIIRKENVEGKLGHAYEWIAKYYGFKTYAGLRASAKKWYLEENFRLFNVEFFNTSDPAGKERTFAYGKRSAPCARTACELVASETCNTLAEFNEVMKYLTATEVIT